MAARSLRGFGQYGGVARAVERVGERWALLIVRDLLSGARRYSDLKAGLPRIPTNILSDRLKELQDAGVIRRVPVLRGGYELTSLGRALEPVVLELERWGWAMLGEPGSGEVLTGDAFAVTLRAAFRPDAVEGEPATEYVLHIGDLSVSAIVAGCELDIIPIGESALPRPGTRISAEPAELLEVATPADGLHWLFDGDEAEVVVGGEELLARFRRTFRLDS